MRRKLSLATEILWRGDDPPAKDRLPETIDDHAARSTVAWDRSTTVPGQPVPRPVRRKGEQGRRGIPRHRISRRIVGAPPQDEGGARLRQLFHDHDLGHRVNRERCAVFEVWPEPQAGSGTRRRSWQGSMPGDRRVRAGPAWRDLQANISLSAGAITKLGRLQRLSSRSKTASSSTRPFLKPRSRNRWPRVSSSPPPPVMSGELVPDHVAIGLLAVEIEFQPAGRLEPS